MTEGRESEKSTKERDSTIAFDALKGRHAFVTGGGRGIGAAIAEALARAGARVTLSGREKAVLDSRVEALRSHGYQAVGAVPLDVTDEASVRSAFDTAREAMGEVAILINNAGISFGAPFQDISLDLWNQHLAVNMTGAFLCSREVLPSMLVAGRGRIVNIASTAGLQGVAHVAAYSASKHGMIGLTRSLAREVARKGITVNAICPGYTETDMADRAIQAVMEATGRDHKAAGERIAQTNVLGRLVRPEEVAAAVLWLCSDAAAAITGQAVVVG